LERTKCSDQEGINNMNQLRIFQFNSKEIRTVEKNGEPWFVAIDIAKALEISNARDTVNMFPENEKDGVGITDAIGREQQTTVISEAGLYRLIFQSRKPEAEKFKTWVVSEVLPSIRKTGSYERPKSFEEQTLEVIQGLVTRVEEMKAKAEFYDQVVESSGNRKIGEAAKLLKIFKPNEFFKRLRDDKILMQNNVPYAQYVEAGYFEVNVTQRNGMTFSTSYVTNKGLAWLQKRYDHIRLKEVV
jgi:anti-repressor protein